MTWTSAMFTPISEEVVDLLTVALPVALGIFAIGLAITIGVRLFRKVK